MSTSFRTSPAPGAMTLAMKAISQGSAAKVLRIGVIQHGRILEERVLSQRKSVTIGTTERNTFTVLADHLPSSFELVTVTTDQFVLNFTEEMEGRLVTSEGILTFLQLRKSGLSRLKNGVFSVRLTEAMRGKLTFGTTSFLFQFVPAPPPQPRAQLPVAIRSNPIKNIDWTYNACVASFVALAFGAFSYAEYLYDPQIEDSFEETARLQHLIMPSVPESPPAPPDARQASNDPPSHEAPSPTTNAANHDSAHRTNATTARADRPARDTTAEAMARSLHASEVALNALERSAVFNPIAGYAPNARGSVTDRIAADPMNQTPALMQGVGGIVGPNSNAAIARRSLYASNGTDPGGLRARAIEPQGPAINTGPAPTAPVRIPAGRITPEQPDDPTGAGTLSADDVAHVVRQNIGAVRWCYNQGLAQNPALQGRIEIHFTIGLSGRISGTPSVSGFDAVPEVKRCLENRFRTFVFPSPIGGSVEFTFPFQFSPGG